MLSVACQRSMYTVLMNVVGILCGLFVTRYGVV